MPASARRCASVCACASARVCERARVRVCLCACTRARVRVRVRVCIHSLVMGYCNSVQPQAFRIAGLGQENKEGPLKPQESPGRIFSKRALFLSLAQVARAFGVLGFGQLGPGVAESWA